MIGLSLVAICMYMTSCRKEPVTFLNFVNASEDVATHQDILDVNEEEIDDQIAQGFLHVDTRAYPTRTWSAPKGTFPNTLTIDYGPDGVNGPHNRVRKGKIIVQLSAPIITPGATRTVTQDNFRIDDVTIEGTVVVTNQGPNSSGQNVLERVVTDRKLLFPNGNTSTWNGTQTITQLEGSSTPDRLDDVFRLEGSSNGVNRNGKTFSTNTTSPLIKEYDCSWISEGVFNIQVESKSLSVDYGNGSCDNKATVTLPDGSTKEIQVKKWWK